MKRRQEHLSDLQKLCDKVAKVADEYKDGGHPYTPTRPGDEKNDEDATLDAKVLRNEYLVRRNKASDRGQGSAEGGGNGSRRVRLCSGQGEYMATNTISISHLPLFIPSGLLLG
jgi:hypothetical protein